MLKAFVRRIEELDEADFDRVIAGDWKIEVGGGGPEPKRSGGDVCSSEEIERLRDELGGVSSRERARELIDGTLRSKADLAAFAKALDVPAPKGASVERLRESLVEATVGFRLRSVAIRKGGQAGREKAAL